MSDPQSHDTGDDITTDGLAAEDQAADELTGLEGYPYASIEAEKRIKLVATSLSIVAVAMLLAGLYLALFTPDIGVGGLLALVGFVALMFVPFVAKRMRRAALAREAEGSA